MQAAATLVAAAADAALAAAHPALGGHSAWFRSACDAVRWQRGPDRLDRLKPETSKRQSTRHTRL